MQKKHFLFIAGIILLLTQQVGAQKTKSLVKSGPMLGYVEHRAALVGLEVTADADLVEIEYWEAKKPTKRNRIPYMGELGKKYNPIHFVLEELEMNTDYEYAIYVNKVLQQCPAPVPYQLHTKELWEWRKPAPDFTFLTGSCLYINDSIYDRPGKGYGQTTKILQPMAAEKADFNLWMGDNIYFRDPDLTSPAGMAYRYSHDRAVTDLQPLLVARPNFALWDDHDFGPNDSDRSFRLKHTARDLFMKYWGNMTYGEQDEGIYSSFTWSDCDFFMMDDRSFRASDNMTEMIDGKPNKQKTYWGRNQLNWLQNALLTSKAPFKFVVNGGQFINNMDTKEAFYNFPAEYQEFMQFLTNSRINGVVLLSGDRHFSEVLELQQPNEGYKIYEITNSSLTSTTYSNMKEPELSNPLVSAGSVIKDENNYGRFSISGERNERKLHYEVLNVAGKKVYELTLNEKDLRWKKGEKKDKAPKKDGLEIKKETAEPKKDGDDKMPKPTEKKD